MRDDNFELLKQGHPDSLVNIHAQYNRQIFWLGKRLIKDEFVIESLVQDSFLKLWMHRDTIESAEHILFFLRFVMKRECISYYTRPRNKFYRRLGHLENYENYQDYITGDDPRRDSENIKDQEQQQQDFDRIKQVLTLLDPAQKNLIEMCLKYGFQYKSIAGVMGTSTTETFNQVKNTIQAIKKILNEGKTDVNSKSSVEMKISEDQEKVFELRCKRNYSFSKIAEELSISQKEVHAAFTTAYKYMKEKYEEQLESA